MRRALCRKSFKVIVGLMVLLLILFATPVGAIAISFFQKTLAGMGQMEYTNEVDIIDIKIKSLTSIIVSVESNDNTVADREYSVFLYLDDERWDFPELISWDIDHIPGSKEKVTFDGLDLTDVVKVDAEVIY